MANTSADSVLGLTDQRLVAALQCDGRLTAEGAARVLSLSPATMRRHLNALTADGTVRVVVSPVARPRDGGSAGALFLRIKVLRGKLDTIVSALAARDDIPFIDVTTVGDEIFAVARTEPGSRDPLVFRRLPATQAVTSLESATVLHVFRLASEWRHAVLTPAECTALIPADSAPRAMPAHSPGPYGVDADPVEQSLIDALAPDARLPATALAARTGHPETTVRRRLAQLTAEGRLVTQVLIDPRRLGLPIEAKLLLHVAPDHLAAAGRALADHPAVHSAFATTGPSNLHAAAYFPDLAALYAFLSRDLVGLGITQIETALVGRTAKRTPPLGPTHSK
ncbi:MULTISPECIES: Lrp/AsnC family transcriptional regulator [unclassified Streptomyces]|uniref:Lrp/AsnC family transcriptional regulator n=1 Tax=unclassified Streptomyces TaxID=2593676 RepID=UPI000DB917FD|nr:MULTISPECIES: Lrp/AsnC family transcriptional regulator [unclassified Streptomyces]MYT73424.1 winged helix-turn-helix transcriptional regulator [Streptomyces sp. SID8367]RAJ84952.1 DNA-binding Lrp family transcriptional regulator [Streptomyces sp. PsTaAH-137]